MVELQSHLIGNLREQMVNFKKTSLYSEIVDPKSNVFGRFQPIFDPKTVSEISRDEFHQFLLFKNNRHWTGLHRHSPRLCEDMDKLREALGILVDENRPLTDRLTEAVNMVPGMGKNIASGILTIIQPGKYGVWNNRSEAVMKKWDIWPEFERGEHFGSRYQKVNEVLLKIKDELQIDLWTLDALWFFIDSEEEDYPVEPLGEEGQCFGLERHLHEFMIDNWDSLELGQEWAIYSEEGDEEAGYEYPCSIGRIDILARHKDEPRWLVIELKRNQTSDQTVGQLLRYMGWVKKNLAEKKEEVQGMIICREVDDALRYALSNISDASLRLYHVKFSLSKPKENLN